MQKPKKASRKNASAAKPAPRVNKKSSPTWRRSSSVLFSALVVLSIGGAVSVLLPASSPLSMARLAGRDTDRVAPRINTLKGNFSVVGEAKSTSLLIKYKASASDITKRDINKKLNANQKRNISRLGVDIVDVKSTDSVGDVIKKYKSRPEIEYVEPNYLAKRFLTPNDTLYLKQWSLQKMAAPEAWEISQGGFGPIAVIDTGISNDQPDLNGFILPGYSFVNSSTDTNDDNGHGTHVAGIISGSSNNGVGIASIGFKGPLLPVKVLDATGAGTYGDVASGIIYATDNGAKIINLSLGGPSSSRTLQDAINYALSRGVVVVAAAGNNGNNSPVYPAAYPGVVAVTATDQNDNLSSFSSYGSHVYVGAPGSSIISTYYTGGYATLSGTSMAAPAVSGLIGLALSKGTTTPSTVLADLKTTSEKVGQYPYDQNGWNQYLGYGRVNAAKLLGVAAVSATTEAEPVSDRNKTPKSDRRNSMTRKADDTDNTNQFDTSVEGVVDSVHTDRSVVMVKVGSSSKNIALNNNNLIDMYITDDTRIKTGNRTLNYETLKSGDRLQVKAHWKDNQLTATEITVTGNVKDKKVSFVQRLLSSAASRLGIES